MVARVVWRWRVVVCARCEWRAGEVVRGVSGARGVGARVVVARGGVACGVVARGGGGARVRWRAVVCGARRCGARVRWCARGVAVARWAVGV